MKVVGTVFFIVLCFFKTNAQETQLPNINALESIGEKTCLCIDSIKSFDRKKKQINLDIKKCIDDKVVVYQMMDKLTDTNNNQKDSINISIDVNKNGKQYQDYFVEIQQYLRSNCDSFISKIASYDKVSSKSYSNDKIAQELYLRGVEAMDKKEFERAVRNFKQTVEADPNFAFAWDNLGISYRYLGKYQKAIESYKKSLEIDPNGGMPLQNIPVTYMLMEKYEKALSAYKENIKRDEKNPEGFYGASRAEYMLENYEKSLDYMCKAFNLYVEQHSAYKADAEEMIAAIYHQMKEQNKTKKFFKILKKNKINIQDDE